MSKLYLCDHKKNTECRKSFCGYLYSDGECFCTKDERFAMINSEGKPIVSPIEKEKNR